MKQLPMSGKDDVVDRRHVKMSTRPHNYRGVPRDVTHDDVIADDDDEGEISRDETRSATAAEWRLSGLWVSEESDVCHVDPFIAAAAAAADDDDDDDDCVDRRRRRSRPDLVPSSQSSFVTSPVARHHQELDKTCHDDVTVLCRFPSPVHCHCVPVSQSDIMRPRNLLTSWPRYFWRSS